MHASELTANHCPGVTRRGIGRWLAGLAVTVTSSTGLAATPSHQSLRYGVTHSVYGSIGNYSNSIGREGEETVVETQLRLVVAFFGIVVHREEAQRSERWLDERLIAFHGVTTVNGTASTVSGEARAGGFVITSPSGVLIAPESVRPSNPWSAAFLSADTMMLSDTGQVEHVRISHAINESVIINKLSVQARAYNIAADPSYKVWLDAHDVPVMFAVFDDTGVVTFTLMDRA